MRVVPIGLVFLVGWLAVAGGCDDGNARERQLEFVSAAEPPEFNRVFLVDAGSDDEQLRVAVYADTIAGMFAGGFRVTYDPSMLQLTSAKRGAELRTFGTNLVEDRFQPGELLVGFVLPEPRDKAVLALLTFTPLAAGSSAVGFAAPVYLEPFRNCVLLDSRGYRRSGVRWFGGTADASRWPGAP